MASKFTVPYAPSSVYRANNSIAELILRAGAVNAEGARRSGEIWGSTIANLGQQVGGAVAQYQQEKQEKKAQSARAAAIDEMLANGVPDLKSAVRVLGPVEGVNFYKGVKALDPTTPYKDQDAALRDMARGINALPPEKRPAAFAYAREQLIRQKRLDPSQVPEQYNQDIIDYTANLGMEPQKPVVVRNALVDPASGKALYTAPQEPPKPPSSFDAAILAADQRGDVAEAKRLMARKAEAESAGRKPEQPARMWVNRNGQLIRIAESEYQPGDQPANIREQGRPVTSGDAGRIADLDTSLDDLNALSKTLSGNKATGTAAKVGASLPNVVTDILGWGVEAKQKQATIDRVKQVIGKALEGGVLRKEDEYKYEKILPTIGDPAEVVKSKLDGLWKAIQLRRQTTLDSLTDAGYDTSKFAARAPRERAAAVTVTAPNGKTYSFKNKAEADAFKKRAGIP